MKFVRAAIPSHPAGFHKIAQGFSCLITEPDYCGDQTKNEV